MKVLYVGYNTPVKTGAIIDNLSINRFCVKTLCKTSFVIDLDGRRIDKKKLKDILTKSKNDIICRISDVERVKSLTRYFDKLYYYDYDFNFNIFHLLKLIFTESNRRLVYKELERWKPPLRVLMKWIISNIIEEDEDNMGWVENIDVYLERVSTKIIWQMISLIEPSYSPFMRFEYSFKKIGERK